MISDEALYEMVQVLLFKMNEYLMRREGSMEMGFTLVGALLGEREK